MKEEGTDAVREGGEGVCDMFLCEASAVYLKPDKLYRFKVDPNCPKCVKIAAAGDTEEAMAEAVRRSFPKPRPTKAKSHESEVKSESLMNTDRLQECAEDLDTPRPLTLGEIKAILRKHGAFAAGGQGEAVGYVSSFAREALAEGRSDLIHARPDELVEPIALYRAALAAPLAAPLAPGETRLVCPACEARVDVLRSVTAPAETVSREEERVPASTGSVVARFRDAMRNVQCGCSVAERDSGHLVDCGMPEADEASDRLCELLVEMAREHQTACRLAQEAHDRLMDLLNRRTPSEPVSREAEPTFFVSRRKLDRMMETRRCIPASLCPLRGSTDSVPVYLRTPEPVTTPLENTMESET